jgi:uncharacterized membrane protein
MDTTTSAAAPATDRRSGLLTIVLGLLVLGIGLWFAIDAFGGWYPVFKWIHVTLAVFWVGGGVTLTVLGLRAERADDPTEIALLARQAAFVGERFFAPAGLLVLLAGIGMVLNGDLDWGQFWVVAGLIGYALTFVTGVAVLSPLAKTIDELAEKEGLHHAATQTAIRKILLIARVDTAVLLLVVADMVTKPFS